MLLFTFYVFSLLRKENPKREDNLWRLDDTHSAGWTWSFGRGGNQVVIIGERNLLKTLARRSLWIFQIPSLCRWWMCSHQDSTHHRAILSHCPKPEEKKIQKLSHKNKDFEQMETLLLTATGTEQPPSRVFMNARSAIVANTVSLAKFIFNTT